ncbi:MAG: hypothetical protein WCI46_13815 [Verrucomicrobiota bacterium]
MAKWVSATRLIDRAPLATVVLLEFIHKRQPLLLPPKAKPTPLRTAV